jgi:hypothetical protein
VILHLVAGDIESADKHTKETRREGLVVIEKRCTSVERTYCENAGPEKQRFSAWPQAGALTMSGVLILA